MVTMRRMNRSPSLRGLLIYEDRPRPPLLRRDDEPKTPDQVLAARGTFYRPPSSPRASATVTIITQGTNRSSLKLQTDTDPVATQESPRGPGGACGGVKENLIIRPSVAIIAVYTRTAKKIIFIEKPISLASVITARGPAPGNPGNLKMLRSHFMGYM